MSSRAQVVNTPFFRGDKCLSTCRSFLTTVLSKLSSTVVIWRSMSVSGSVRNSDFYIRSRIRWIRSLSEALAYPHLAGPAYRMRLIVVALRAVATRGRAPPSIMSRAPYNAETGMLKLPLFFVNPISTYTMISSSIHGFHLHSYVYIHVGLPVIRRTMYM